ncbi:MAG: hypothetical protein JJU34_17925 [Lunatimonas sp.]|uniref:hypothetical protein n=1 Tax=Lunatimonas sp. TaxID=2060141 RepID=UPI00263AB689|nr:hypothetical protein [Lunatimonas sp.]MCC5939163.1 hypothetical protein [Lunatimonas sp.]
MNLIILEDNISMAGASLQLPIRIENNLNEKVVLLGSKYFDVSRVEKETFVINRLMPGFTLFLFDKHSNHIIDVDQKIQTGKLHNTLYYYDHEILIDEKQTISLNILIDSDSYIIPKGRYKAFIVYLQKSSYTMKDLETRPYKIRLNYTLFDGIIKSNYFTLVVE